MRNICEKFGDNVRKFRSKMKLSQEELAGRCELHRTYISAVERGLRSVSLKNIEILARELKIEIYQLFIFEEEKNDE
ncbi:MAG: helix-turn-helix protein [candidate division CPR1 bacterium ADurb.Bin160]|uniref:Helix-turn-helix protein n=1 Tax=candidate division CPR1 bacterium ADurb.Bin160 TaxID=1852826 RepID=A0A1V5ZIE5_9BACT|nr:MAG: helix-turn-helix protein [candidate division CPR1 bacterium ADurb.Bin160]